MKTIMAICIILLPLPESLGRLENRLFNFKDRISQRNLKDCLVFWEVNEGKEEGDREDHCLQVLSSSPAVPALPRVGNPTEPLLCGSTMCYDF